MIKQYELWARAYADMHADDDEPIELKLESAYRKGYLQARHDAVKMCESVVLLRMPNPLTFIRSHLKILGIRESKVLSGLMVQTVLRRLGEAGSTMERRPFRFPDEPESADEGPGPDLIQ